MGTMKAAPALPATRTLLLRPHSIATVILLVAFVVAFTMPSIRFGVSTFGLITSLVVLPFMGKHTSPATRWIERVTMLQFAIIFLQWVAK